MTCVKENHGKRAIMGIGGGDGLISWGLLSPQGHRLANWGGM